MQRSRSPSIGADAFLQSRIDYERTIPAPYSHRTFKLERMRELLAALGNPHNRLPVVHVAGTKGKGSTAAMIAASLHAAGCRVGLFSSPHLERVEERIAINGEPFPPDQLALLAERARPLVEAMDRVAEVDAGCGPTYFEIVTALAFCRFAAENVDCAVLEVGLGGRLDSTNVCQPLVSVITSISFDHVQQLGATLEAITAEKAGIIKPATPVVSGVIQPEPQRVIATTAQSCNSPVRQIGRDFQFAYRPPRRLEVADAQGHMDFVDETPGGFDRVTDLTLGLLGPHQAANAAVAMATLGEMRRQGWVIPLPAVREGLAKVRWPARMELIRRRPAIVLDAAHNVASVEALLETLDQSFSARRKLLVFATSRDKDVRGMLELLAPRFDCLMLSRYGNNARGAPVEDLELLAREMTQAPVQGYPDLKTAWRAASAWLQPDDLLVITGSFFIAAEMLAAIRECPLVLNVDRPTPTAPC
jgi:dihydrofolate synthase / folylpolyglutamate synthase